MSMKQSLFLPLIWSVTSRLTQSSSVSDLFMRAPYTDVTGPRTMEREATILGCAGACLSAPVCVAFTWEPNQDLKCGIMTAIAEDPKFRGVVYIFKGNSKGQFVSLQNPAYYDWHWTRQVCSSLGLTMVPSPKTISELTGLSFYRGFVDILYNFTAGVVTDNAGTALDVGVVAALPKTSSLTATGYLRILYGGRNFGVFSSGASIDYGTCWAQNIPTRKIT
ncbi:uncharacterized protein LOC108682086 [Hyalella azteca]|uniref:Uncharacterized protein LOC108682086 n=1 Tax=Hyalella azteca TaxID=294128 RepID=A0A8B7PMU1_HYAAZ|nr:uncharacterized protein LOC108682086 [Hyalella azteca]